MSGRERKRMRDRREGANLEREVVSMNYREKGSKI